MVKIQKDQAIRLHLNDVFTMGTSASFRISELKIGTAKPLPTIPAKTKRDLRSMMEDETDCEEELLK